WIRRGSSLRPYFSMLFPIAVVLILSVGRIYRLVGLVGIPLLASQRVATRLIVVPVTITVVLAVLGFEQAMREQTSGTARLLTTGGLVLLAHDLWQHLRLWRVVNMPGLFPTKPLDLSVNIVANHPDPPYELSLGVGAAISLVSLIALIALALNRRSDDPGPASRAA
ncbi:MAG: hypothetical protein ACRDHG_08940, partial [Anaerolineales bacterium]